VIELNIFFNHYGPLLATAGVAIPAVVLAVIILFRLVSTRYLVHAG